MFVGRYNELKELKEKLNNNKFESILIYGRRRIGKTELIRQAQSSFNGLNIYYEFKRSLFGDNLDGINYLFKQIFKVNYSFSNIKDALKYVFDYSINNKVCLVLDELPFIWETYPLIISDLRDLIDEYISKCNLKLIISGSYVDMMKSLNDGKSETYGRFTSIIELKPFDYYDSALFYPNYSNEDKILMYSVFGGVAFFNSLIDNKLSAIDNIKRLIVGHNSILQLEVENTISSETNKIEYVNSVIELIGRGVNKYSDISNNLTSKANGKVNPDYIIKKLLDLEIIERICPINDKLNKKKVFYRFKDNLMEFYYRYIYRNKNMNVIMNVDDFYNEIIKDDLNQKYLPKKFERISREYLIRASSKHLLKNVIYEIGTYFFDDSKNKINRQFDVVTLDKLGYISYECKYTNSLIDNSVVIEEENQAKELNIDFYKLGFISKNGFEDGIDKGKYNIISLNDFYSKEL